MSQLDNIRMGNINSSETMEIVDPNLQRGTQRNTAKRNTDYASAPQALQQDEVEIIDPNLANVRQSVKKIVNMNDEKPSVISTMREGGNTVGDGNGERVIVNPEATVPNIEKPKTNIIADAINDTFKAVERRGKEMQEYADELHDTMEALGTDEVTDEVIEAMKISAQDRKGSYAYMEKHGQSQGFQDSGKMQFYDPEKGNGVMYEEEEEDEGDMYSTNTDTKKVDLFGDDEDDEMLQPAKDVVEPDEEEDQVYEEEEYDSDPEPIEPEPEYDEEIEEESEQLEEVDEEEDLEVNTAEEEPDEEMKEEVPDIDVSNDITITNNGVYMGNDEEEEEDEDTSDEVEDDGSPIDPDENMEELRQFVLANIYPEAKKTKVMNLKDFRVNKKVIPATRIKTDAIKSVDWSAYYTGTGFTQSAMSGSEIQNLNAIMIDDDTSIRKRILAMLHSLYDHCDTKGNLSFNAWAKRFDARDLNNLCAGQYFACFADSNYQMIECQNDNCKYNFFTSNIKPMKMIEFKTPEIKKEFLEIRKSVKNNNTLITDNLVPMGSKHYIQYKNASLYDIYIATQSMDREFAEKYDTALQMAANIYAIYEVSSDGSLSKVGWKEYPNDETKTLRSKTMAINRLLRHITSDELQDFIVNLNEIGKTEKELDDVRYFIPEITCPRCGKVVEKSYIESMHRYLFTRHRLVALKSTPEKQ